MPRARPQVPLAVRQLRKTYPGDTVPALRDVDLQVVKRVVELLPDGRLLLHGDNPAASTDSHEFGPVAPEYLIGRVTSRFA